MSERPPYRIRIHSEGSGGFRAMRDAFPDAAFSSESVIISYDQRFIFLRWPVLAVGFFLLGAALAIACGWVNTSVDASRLRLAVIPLASGLVCLYGYHVFSSPVLWLAFAGSTLYCRIPRPGGLGTRRLTVAREDIEDVVMDRRTTPVGPSYRIRLLLAHGRSVPLIRHERSKRRAAWLESFIVSWLG